MIDPYYNILRQLLDSDERRMEILRTVEALSLPDCWVAAGFVRNLVWDELHGIRTDLNDVDVIYYCQEDTQSQLAIDAYRQLQSKLPKVKWQVKNQAVMHLKRQHEQYTSSVDAMTYWPERETAVGVKLDETEALHIVAPFHLSSLFKGSITYNPQADEQDFWQRIEKKKWLDIWPKLVIRDGSKKR